ncbi:hypothetical protein [Kitasatospora sp. DSM 101779]|uniref:hypothetical protein n=1 Tax=Kitasatospora sp. DSM 101779 TaxID=2853165 RepID=UPI0021D82041|nr:hypothetical protein [Kitasatospora sp. DSM 101779]MCU7820437.1 hypothetical protein [Kitasatospora sp. DSM 101779]
MSAADRLSTAAASSSLISAPKGHGIFATGVAKRLSSFADEPSAAAGALSRVTLINYLPPGAQTRRN